MHWWPRTQGWEDAILTLLVIACIAIVSLPMVMVMWEAWFN